MEELNKAKLISTKVLVDKPEWRKDYKLLVAAIQSYLAGSQDIYVAFKNKYKPGIVEKRIEHLTIKDVFEVNIFVYLMFVYNVTYIFYL